MSAVNHTLSEKPIPSRKELVERMTAAFGRPARMNSTELIWPSITRLYNKRPGGR